MIALRSARCLEFGGALATPASNAQASWGRRAGLLLQLAESRGHAGEGEASPLPGLSRESLADCRAALAGLPLDGLRLDENMPFAEWAVATAAIRAGLPPAARCALETAALDLLGRVLGRPTWALLAPRGPSAPAPLPLGALLIGETPDQVAAEAASARARGMRCLKLKVGRPGALEREIELARAAREAAPDVDLRLDANRALRLAEALPALHRLAALGCELVEEPAAELDLVAVAAGDRAAREIARRIAASPIPVALDESLRDVPAGTLRAVAGEGFPAAVVLKPTILGGPARALEIAAEARDVGVDVIVTHALDGPVALAAAAAVALAVGSTRRAMGLDVHPGLGAWPRRVVPALRGAVLVPWNEPGLGVVPLATEEGR